MTNDKKTSAIFNQVKSFTDTICEMALKVWIYAELGFQEEKSSACESGVLKDNGFTISGQGIGGMDEQYLALTIFYNW
jgi:aminobenzoyl-glutamate utilization protein B